MAKKGKARKAVAKKAVSKKATLKKAVAKKAAGGGGANIAAVRAMLGKFLDWGEAHVSWEKALEGLEPEKRGLRPQGVPHSPWELLEHTRIAQWDILEFTRDAKHKSPEWPSGYWPKSPAPADDAAWDKTVKELFSGMKEMEKIANDPKVPLDGKLPHGTGQTLLRQLLLLADHNAYHLGEFVLVRRALGSWKGN